MSYDGAALVVNFARLQETSGHIQSVVGTLESQLSTVEADAAPLLGTWSGEARDAYQQRQGTWRRAAAELTAMLVSIRRAVDESVADYAMTERRNADLFR